MRDVMTNKLLLIVVFLLLSFSAANAQAPFPIQIFHEKTPDGPVLGWFIIALADAETEEPIPGATITMSVHGVVVRQDVTDANGEVRWQVRHSNRPIYMIAYSHPDYGDAIIPSDRGEKWNLPWGWNCALLYFISPPE